MEFNSGFKGLSTSLPPYLYGQSTTEPYHLSVPIVLKSGSLRLLEPSGPVQACNGIALPLPLPEYNRFPFVDHPLIKEMNYFPFGLDSSKVQSDCSLDRISARSCPKQ